MSLSIPHIYINNMFEAPDTYFCLYYLPFVSSYFLPIGFFIFPVCIFHLHDHVKGNLDIFIKLKLGDKKFYVV